MEIINVKVGSPSQSTNVDIENPSQVKAEIKNITINTGGSSKAVLYYPQELTSEQKQQARANIGAASQKDLQDGVNEALKEAKESGDFNGPAGYTPVKGEDYFDGEDGKDATVKIESSGVVKEYPELKIHQVSQAEYEALYEADELEENSIYVTPVNEILSIEQIVASAEDGGNNVIKITLTDGTSINFVVKNGSKGDKGDDGVSPTVSVNEIEGGYKITITDINGTNSVDIMHGSTPSKTEVWNFTLEDGSVVTKEVYVK